MTEQKKRLALDYKWVIVALSFLMVMVALGFASSTRSLFPDEIAKALGTERSLVSIGESIRYIATAIVNVFFGAMVAKFGPKKLIVAGFVSLIGSMLLYSVAESLWVIYVAGALLGIGFSWTSTTMVGYIIGVWCSENKGTIMGLILASNGLGGAIAIQLAGGLIDPEVVGSYRAAYRMIAIVLAATLVILIAFFKDKPKTPVAPISGTHVKKHKARGKDWVGIEFSSAIKRFYFWGALVCIFFSGLILQGTSGIVAMHLKDVGIDYGKVKALLSFGSIILASAKFLTGFIYDKGGLRIAASFCNIVAILSVFCLAFIKNDSLGFTLAIVYTVISQFSLPLETIMLPLYASDLFGQKSYVTVLGIFVSVNVFGYAVGAPLMNLCYDIFGSYVPALILVGVIMSAVFVLLQVVITLAHREQRRICREQ